MADILLHWEQPNSGLIIKLYLSLLWVAFFKPWDAPVLFSCPNATALLTAFQNKHVAVFLLNWYQRNQIKHAATFFMYSLLSLLASTYLKLLFFLSKTIIIVLSFWKCIILCRIGADAVWPLVMAVRIQTLLFWDLLAWGYRRACVRVIIHRKIKKNRIKDLCYCKLKFRKHSLGSMYILHK